MGLLGTLGTLGTWDLGFEGVQVSKNAQDRRAIISILIGSAQKEVLPPYPSTVSGESNDSIVFAANCAGVG